MMRVADQIGYTFPVGGPPRTGKGERCRFFALSSPSDFLTGVFDGETALLDGSRSCYTHACRRARSCYLPAFAFQAARTAVSRSAEMPAAFTICAREASGAALNHSNAPTAEDASGRNVSPASIAR